MYGGVKQLSSGVLSILVLATIPAVATAWLHPKSPYKEDHSTNAETAEGVVTFEAIQAWPGGVLWIDARSDEDYEHAHIPGALLLNEDGWDDQVFQVFDAYKPGDKIVVYCASGGCRFSEEVATRLREESGIDDIYTLKGGWDAWRNQQ